MQAAPHGRSDEAEVREILASSVKPGTRVRLGDALAALGREIGVTHDDVECSTVHAARHRKPYDAAGVPVINPWETERRMTNALRQTR
jgi:plasmid stability protein